MTTQSDNRPWGYIVGLLTACLVTLIGVLSGLDPYVILLRAAGASVATGCVTSIVAGLVQVLKSKS